MRYLTLGEVVELHRLVLGATGGAPRIRDLGALESAIAQPTAAFGGTDLYPTPIEKAAALCFALVQGHPFVDFKGHFRTRDGIYGSPLTVADQHTRYLLGCHGLLSTQGQGVRPIFDRLFREYGLPRAIRTDNGVPFATTGIHGLSQLNVWWIRLGIQHQRILPASPQQNGAHERMHRTLKAATARPPRGHLTAQQRAFNRFRVLYNEERPHQFLWGQTPASRYQPSPRLYTGDVPPIEYPGHDIPKRVTNAGTIRFKKRLLFIANSLKQQVVGLEEVDDGVWSLYFCHVLLARIDERDYVLRA